MRTLLLITIVALTIANPPAVGESNFGVPYQRGNSQKNDDTFQSLKQSFNNMIDVFASINTTVGLLVGRVEKLEEFASKSIIQQLDSLMASVGTRMEMLEGSVYKPLMDEFIRRPRARLFRNENFNGRSEDYNLESATLEGGCKNLESLNASVRSADTYSTCVRLFQERFCDGWSLAVYPGSDNANKVLNLELTSVQSIGPCLPNEFEYARFRDMGKHNIAKHTGLTKNYVPDLLKFPGTEEHSSRVVVNNEFSIRKYALGPKNRIQFLLALITLKHVNISQTEVKTARWGYTKSLNFQHNDVAGYGIPLELGGPANENYNLFAQTRSGAERWRQLTSEIPKFLRLQDSNFVYLSVNFFYEDEKETRPYAFTYNIYYNETKVSYGRVQN